MSELRAEAVNLIEEMPEKYLLAIVHYKDKIAEYVNKIVKADRHLA